MAGFRDRDKQYFPLENINSVVELFRDQLEFNSEPNLALLSIVLGTVENYLTMNRAIPSDLDESKTIQPIFPIIQLSTVEALYQRFATFVKGNVDLSSYDFKYATRDFVKKVSDVIWMGLARTYHKDKAHIQSLYSYLTGNKLDCFGVALAVVAACQLLGFNDVHLALSEDHAWVVFGEYGTETAEVTWHGKGVEDKRGQSIDSGIAERSWLYLNNNAVICNRHMEVVSMVSSINPAITSSMDSIEMSNLQQDLLWLLYDLGHMEKYPMALGNLGDLEELNPTPVRPTEVALFLKAIDSSRKYYADTHVYPYTYLGSCYYRKKMYKEAIRNWSLAAKAISNFNYSREDEEIYKEFLEIANDLIPHIAKEAADKTARHHSLGPETGYGNDPPLLQDPEVYALLLQFYDGICQWEEGSSTPVLHITWATHLVFSLGKFQKRAREAVEIEGANSDESDSEADDREIVKRMRRETRVRSTGSDDSRGEDGRPKRPGRPPKKKLIPTTTIVSPAQIVTVEQEKITEKINGHISHDSNSNVEKIEKKNGEVESKVDITKCAHPEVNGNHGNVKEDQITSTIQELASKVQDEGSQNEAPNPNIMDLARACSDAILNPEYLLGVGEPFTTAPTTHIYSTPADTKVDFNEFLSSQSNGTPFPGITLDSILKADSPAEMMLTKSRPDSVQSIEKDRLSVPPLIPVESVPPPKFALKSAKMNGIRNLLRAEKLNSNAIKLQVTAQSQVYLKHSKVASEYDYGLPRKRTRRD